MADLADILTIPAPIPPTALLRPANGETRNPGTTNQPHGTTQPTFQARASIPPHPAPRPPVQARMATPYLPAGNRNHPEPRNRVPLTPETRERGISVTKPSAASAAADKAASRRPSRARLALTRLLPGPDVLQHLRANWAQVPALLPRLLAAVLVGVLAFALLSPGHLPLTMPADAADASDGGLAVEPMPFEQPGQSWPGSAFYYLAPDPVQQNGGNPLAPDAHWDGTGPQELNTGPIARPLAIISSQTDRLRALSCLTTAIYYEAATEPDAGQRAVAQVILNRMAHPAFPKTVCGVVYQGSERATGCQFTFTCDGSMARKPMAMFWNRAEAVARDALNGYVYAPVGLATHYHTFQVHPYWDDSLNFIGQIGAHRFYRFEGPAGSPEAFATVYHGGEPVPGPHPRSMLINAKADSAVDPLAVQRAFAAGVKAAQAAYPATTVMTSHVGGGLPTPAYTSEELRHGGDAVYRASNLPESRNVNPEYQNSGRWLGDPQ